jgi:hypothetical protein
VFQRYAIVEEGRLTEAGKRLTAGLAVDMAKTPPKVTTLSR